MHDRCVIWPSNEGCTVALFGPDCKPRLEDGMRRRRWTTHPAPCRYLIHDGHNVSVALNHEGFPVTSPIGFLKSGVRTWRCYPRGLRGLAMQPNRGLVGSVAAQNHANPFLSSLPFQQDPMWVCTL